jgi:DNA primase
MATGAPDPGGPDGLRQLGNAQRLLAPISIINPYAPLLTFPTGRTRTRRDHEKYLTLIDAITLLHQRQRKAAPLPHAPHGAKNYIEVTLDDIALANQLAPEVLGRSLDELPPQTRRLLGHIRQLVKNRKIAPGGRAQASSTFSRRELREACGWSLTQVRTHLERLVELEYLTLRHGRLGSPFVYELLIDTDAPENVAHIGLIQVDDLRQKYGCLPNLAGFTGGVAGQNGHLAGGGESGPPGLKNSQPEP